MRFSLAIILLLVSSVVISSEQTTHYTGLYESANDAYRAGEFDSAKALYTDIFQNEMVAPELFFNLGNTHYREGNYPAAILFYERALRLDPGDDDIQYNLKIAQQFVTDKIEPIQPFFVSKWWVGAAKLMSPNQWSWIFLLLLVFACSLFTLYFIASNRSIRQMGFLGGLITIIFSVVLYSLASTSNQEQTKGEAIVFASSANVKSAPGLNSADQFVIHAGLKVKVVGEDGDWSRIELYDGNSGWIYTQSIEKI